MITRPLPRLARATLLAAAVGLAACRTSPAGAPPTDARPEILAALERYRVAARAVDAESSAAFFAPDGVLFEPGIAPIVSPDSIRAFIRSFPGVQVDSAMLRADTVEVSGTAALVWGTYFERLRFPGQPPSAQYGRFVMQWRQAPDGRWLIGRYYRVPLPPNWKEGS